MACSGTVLEKSGSMEPIQKSVKLSHGEYTVHVGINLRAELRSAIDAAHAEGRSMAVVTDERVAGAQADFMREVFGDLPVHSIPAGEPSKCFRMLEQCCEWLASKRLDRSSLLFAFGGGVTGDLAGFAAASYQRGIDFIQVPTTLLAMVDSSVGGKTGINLAAGKNLVGAFHQPKAVFADVELLKTLPAPEFSAGMAEVIKHALIADDKLFARLLDGDRLEPGTEELAQIIAENVGIKAHMVGLDETETAAVDGRALLNLGHTFGHAIEAATGYKSYLHGEAIAVGLRLALELSIRKGFFRGDEMAARQQLLKLLARYQLPMRLREPLPIERLREAMMRDKKVRSGQLKFVILNRVGNAVTTTQVDWADVDPLWNLVQPEVTEP